MSYGNLLNTFTLTVGVIFLLNPAIGLTKSQEPAQQTPDALNLIETRNLQETLPPGWQVIQDDAFEKGESNHWHPHDDQIHKIEMSWGKLKITNKLKDSWFLLYSDLPVLPLGDYRIEMRLSVSGGEKRLKVFWESQSSGNNNALDLNFEDRSAKVTFSRQGKEREVENLIVPSKNSRSSFRGFSSANLVALQKTGNQLNVFLNGETVFRGDAPETMGGKIGFSIPAKGRLEIDRIVAVQDVSAMKSISALSYAELAARFPVVDAEFSPDAGRLVTASSLSKKIRTSGITLLDFWDVTGPEPKQLARHLYWDEMSFNRSFSFSRNGKTFAMLTPQGIPVLAELVDGNVSVKREFGNIPAKCVALSSDASTLATCEETKLTLFDTATGKPGKTASTKKPFFFERHLRFSPDGKYLVVSGAQMEDSKKRNNAWLFETATMREITSEYAAAGLFFNLRSSGYLNCIQEGLYLGLNDLSGKRLATGYDGPGIRYDVEKVAMDNQGNIFTLGKGNVAQYLHNNKDILYIAEHIGGADNLAVAFDPRDNRLMLAARGRFHREHGAEQQEVEAKRLYSEGIELLQNGFEAPGSLKIRQAVELDPFIHHFYTFRLLRDENPLLTLAGHVYLRQYRSSIEGVWDPILGIRNSNIVGENREITWVMEGSGAELSGLRKGDILHSINGKTVENISDFYLEQKLLQPGSMVEVGILRNGQEMSFRVMVEKTPRYAEFGIVALVYYGLAAARAGKLDLSEWAASKARRLGQEDPAAFNRETTAQIATALEGMAMVAKGKASGAYDEMALKGGLANAWLKSQIMNFPSSWAPLYADKKKLAYLLQVKETELKDPVGAWPIPAEFPDKSGTLVKASGTRMVPQKSTTSLPEKREKKKGGIILE